MKWKRAIITTPSFSHYEGNYRVHRRESGVHKIIIRIASNFQKYCLFLYVYSIGSPSGKWSWQIISLIIFWGLKIYCIESSKTSVTEGTRRWNNAACNNQKIPTVLHLKQTLNVTDVENSFDRTTFKRSKYGNHFLAWTFFGSFP